MDFMFRFLFAVAFSFFLVSVKSIEKPNIAEAVNIREASVMIANNQHETTNMALLLEKRKDTINEVKKSQLLLMAIISLFVLGLVSLIYYSKKIKIINKQLHDYSRENAFLLSEANHRINNNLQLIIVLISDEIKKNKDFNENSSIKKILSKVESIATLHRHLYKSADKRKIDIEDYLREIERNFQDIFKASGVNARFQIASFKINTDNAMYLGLLLTELCINTLKHAFSEQTEKNIDFVLFETKGVFIFKYSDNGLKSAGKEFLPKLAVRICNQLKADYQIAMKNGFSLEFTKELDLEHE